MHYKKVNGMYSSLWETNRRAAERHLPYGITQCYLPPDTGINAPHLNCSQAGRYSIYLPRSDGRLSSHWCWLYAEIVYLSADSHPSP